MGKCHVSKVHVEDILAPVSSLSGSMSSIMQEKQLDVLILKLTYCDAITRTGKVTVEHGQC